MRGISNQFRGCEIDWCFFDSRSVDRLLFNNLDEGSCLVESIVVMTMRVDGTLGYVLHRACTLTMCGRTSARVSYFEVMAWGDFGSRRLRDV